MVLLVGDQICDSHGCGLKSWLGIIA